MVLNPKNSDRTTYETDESLTPNKPRSTSRSVLKIYLFITLATVISVITITLLVFFLK